MIAEEGRIQLESGHRLWYWRVGGGPGIPLLTLHGGPGSGHDYLEPLERLAKDRPVVFYDQLGCGKSDQPSDPSLWKLERFCTELQEVRDALGLRQIHLLGQSWGGMLAIEYLLSRPAGVAGLVLSDAYASMPQLAREVDRLRQKLPEKIRRLLDRCEKEDDFHDPDCRNAVNEFYHQHVFRLTDKPACLLRTMENLRDNPVYQTMNGPNELVITGNLKAWDRTGRLPEIAVPALVLAGRYDEATPTCAETLHQRIAGSQMVIFENSSHLPHIEEADRYIETVARFLRQVEDGTSAHCRIQGLV